jgi:RimJ/RimL family protein N-acetyltransferase
MDTTESSPIVNIEGQLVSLGPLDRSMLPLFQRWINDFAVQARVGTPIPGPFTYELEEQWYESVSTGSDRYTFAIREGLSGSLIGSAALHAIDFRSGSAIFGIMIGEPTARGKGYGTETTSLMLDYAFTILGLHSVNLTVAGFNYAGQAAYRKAGFRECGRLREHIRFAGKWWDQVQMDCLAHEFESPVLAKLIDPH